MVPSIIDAIPMTISCFHDDCILFEKPQAIFFSSLIKLANCSVKLGVHVYYIVSMTTTTTNNFSHSSNNGITHVDETWYARV